MSGVIAFLAGRSLRQHGLATWLTVLAVALAGGLALSVLSIRRQTDAAFFLQHSGFDAVLGARGSPVQLVLNTIYHLETSPGNIPWSLYTTMRDDPRVSLALPYVLGDNFHGHRIVGTIPKIFTDYRPRADSPLEFETGRAFSPDRREAVVGWQVARRLNLAMGATIHPYHGLTFDPRMKHDTAYQVVGVLKATGTPLDRVVWIPLEQFYRMEGHVLRGSGVDFRPGQDDDIPEEHREVSAVMIVLKDRIAGFDLAQEINNQGRVATFAFPVAGVMLTLFDKFGWVNRILELVAGLVIVVALAGVTAALHNALHERRRDFAILRSLGASRRTVVGVVIGQAVAIAALGAVAAFGVHAVILGVAARIVRHRVGVDMVALDPGADWFWVAGGLLVAGALSGTIPAIRAYRVDVVRHLHHGG